MNVAIIVDELSGADNLISFLEDPKKVDSFLGLESYEGTYKNRFVTVFFCTSSSKAIEIRGTDLFLFRDFDVVINIGYCYSINPKEFPEFSLALVSQSRCDADYGTEVISTEITSRIIEVNKKIEKRFSEVSQKLDFPLHSTSCCSIVSLFSSVEDYEKISTPLIDLKSYALYNIANSHNRKTVSLYSVRALEDTNLISMKNERHIENINKLFLLSLEFLKKWV